MEPKLIEIAIEPKRASDQKRLAEILVQLGAEDSSLCVTFDSESGQSVVAGTSEAQLEAILDSLQREIKGAVNIGAPQVAYRETITRRAEITYTHKQQNGGSGQYAR